MKQDGIAAVMWVPYEERTEQIAELLGATLHSVHYLRYKRPLLAPIKYGPQFLKTLAVLRRQRPSIVYVMNPPAFAALSVYLYGRASGTPYVMDTHPPALYSKKWGWTAPLQRALARRALVNIVDQERFRRSFESWGAKALVLQCPIASRLGRGTPPAPDSEPFAVTVVNTFARDEPLAPILGAAQRLPEVRFFITGDTSFARNSLLREAPANVVFTGYLRGEDYWARLRSARAVMALTTYSHSLLLGAQEGMAVGKPLLLSRQPALTEYFTKGAVFVDNTVDSVVDGLRQARENEHILGREILDLGHEKRAELTTQVQRLQAVMRDATGEDVQAQ